MTYALVREAMEEIARWFDLELVNGEKIPYWMTLAGVVCRGMSLDELAGLLKARGLQFQVEGRRLVFRLAFVNAVSRPVIGRG